MPRVESIRSEVRSFMKARPFQPFALNMENGDRIIIEHPENIAFDPSAKRKSGSEDFYVITSQLRVFSSFSAVTSVAVVDRAEV